LLRLDGDASGNSSNERRAASAGGKRLNMKTTSESKLAAIQPRLTTTTVSNAMTRGSHRKTEPSAFRRPNPRGPLAHAETLTGDRITAENYFQHAEHYLRSMDNSN